MPRKGEDEGWPAKRKKETKNQPEVFQTEVFSWMSARDVRPRMLVFQAFGGPDRSFVPEKRTRENRLGKKHESRRRYLPRTRGALHATPRGGPKHGHAGDRNVGTYFRNVPVQHAMVRNASRLRVTCATVQ